MVWTQIGCLACDQEGDEGGLYRGKGDTVWECERGWGGGKNQTLVAANDGVEQLFECSMRPGAILQKRNQCTEADQILRCSLLRVLVANSYFFQEKNPVGQDAFKRGYRRQ